MTRQPPWQQVRVPQLNKTFESVSFDERLNQFMNHCLTLLITTVENREFSTNTVPLAQPVSGNSSQRGLFKRRAVPPIIQLDMASVTHNPAIAASLGISICRNRSNLSSGVRLWPCRFDVTG